MSDETCCGACGYPIHATKESACDWCRQSAARIEALTAKLAKAVEALQAFKAFDEMPTRYKRPDVFEVSVRRKLLSTLAEIEGEKG
jgi:predicted DsbA family dithiol-disulfide isomerase